MKVLILCILFINFFMSCILIYRMKEMMAQNIPRTTNTSLMLSAIKLIFTGKFDDLDASLPPLSFEKY